MVVYCTTPVGQHGLDVGLELGEVFLRCGQIS